MSLNKKVNKNITGNNNLKGPKNNNAFIYYFLNVFIYVIVTPQK